ncbi:MAG: OmpA family protein [Bacteroidetes bacterium]|nr:OmpA family protein [Bacteroidota bacterium]
MKFYFCVALWLLTFSTNAQNLSAYGSYDFVAGEKVIFEDNFKDDKPNTAPARWKTLEGKGVVIEQGAEKIISILTYYTKLAPKTKTPAYLPKTFTVEFDYYLDAGYEGNPGVMVSFRNAANEETANIIPNKLNTSFGRPGTENLIGENPPDILNEAFYNKWHHIAIAYGNNQMKIYINQHMVLEIPRCDFTATSLVMAGDASENMNMFFKNFRLAEGGNSIVKSLAEGKLVTHAIRFDVNKADVRGESMGFIRQVADYLKANPGVKFEIGGHTDSDGDDASNLKLSEQRAEAVKTILLSLGVADKQLSVKGYGETKPLSPNTTPDGKANNRRVEFVRIAN